MKLGNTTFFTRKYTDFILCTFDFTFCFFLQNISLTFTPQMKKNYLYQLHFCAATNVSEATLKHLHARIITKGLYFYMNNIVTKLKLVPIFFEYVLDTIQYIFYII